MRFRNGFIVACISIAFAATWARSQDVNNPGPVRQSGGAYGLGILPSAWSTSIYTPLQISNATFAGITSNGQAEILGNLYFNGTNYVHQTTNPAAILSISGAGGAIFFQTAPSATAGTNATVTAVGGFRNVGGFFIGANQPTMGQAELGLNRSTVAAVAPTANGGVVIKVRCGTNAGTAKIVAAAGTSSTETTILDNIGAGVTGC